MTHLLMESAALSRFQAEHILRIGLLRHSPSTLDEWYRHSMILGLTKSMNMISLGKNALDDRADSEKLNQNWAIN